MCTASVTVVVFFHPEGGFSPFRGETCSFLLTLIVCLGRLLEGNIRVREFGFAELSELGRSPRLPQDGNLRREEHSASTKTFHQQKPSLLPIEVDVETGGRHALNSVSGTCFVLLNALLLPTIQQFL